MKIIAIVLILVCLLEPMRQRKQPRPQANVMAILIDDSASMNANLGASDKTRHQQALMAMDDETPWRIRLGQMFDVRSFAFDARTRRIQDADQLEASGQSSSLGSALTNIRDRLRHRPVAGVMVWTDGNATDINKASRLADLGIPVFPVVAKDAPSFSDLRLADVSIAQSNFETSPTTVSAVVENLSETDRNVTVSLVHRKTKSVVQEHKVRITSQESKTVSFSFRPEESGVQFYEVNVADSSPDQNEVTLENNRRLITVDRDRGPYRILYVAGRPNWDFKFLRRALDADPEIELVGLLRIANKQPKFSFRGQGSGDTNPLFAGLGADEEETASQYDEPVMVRLGVKESTELVEGFPKTDEELFAYDGIILDDIGSDFFSQDQLTLLRRFVDARGGGMMMLGGQGTLSRKDLRSTTLGELIPVYPGKTIGVGRESNQEVRLELSQEGILSPWTRLRETQSAEQDRQKEMTSFRTWNPIGDPKPGSSTMAFVVDSKGDRRPALVTQRFGAGRTAVMAIGDFWRWSMRPADAEEALSQQQDKVIAMGSEDQRRMWRQMVRWLVGEVPSRVELRLVPSLDSNEPTIIQVTARDEQFLPLDNASVTISVTDSEGKTIELSPTADNENAGVYESQYWTDSSGGYVATTNVSSDDGTYVGTDEAGWSVDRAATEWNKLQINQALLDSIANDTGGQIVDVDKVDAFVDQLSQRDVPQMETTMVPLWHQSWIMFLAIACLCGEWFLRRTKGMA